MKIAIEGMDGVGKTTIAKRLAEELNYTYIDKPLHYFLNDEAEESYKELNKILSKMYKMDDPVIKSWLIGLGNLYSVRHFKNENIVLDRHLVSNYFWNGTQDSNIVFKTMMQLMDKPDMTILLYASPETRHERMKKRNPNDRDITDPEIMVVGYDKMKKFLEDFEIPYIPINTENRTEEIVYQNVYEKVLEKIKEEKDGNIEPSR